MSWKEVTKVSLRIEFVTLAVQKDRNVSELCRHYGISRKTGYKWLDRFRDQGIAGLEDKSRRPLTSPNKMDADVEECVVRARKEHAAWGGRKLRQHLLNSGEEKVPAASTITEILKRKEQISPLETAENAPWQRFEHERPNDLWQMDFKGPVKTDEGNGYLLTVLDDHARFSLIISACRDQLGSTVKEKLIPVFERYGLPWKILSDNGGPWSGSHGSRYSYLVVWLIRLGISVVHGRAYHPQTQGKEERFHRTLIAEVLRYNRFRDLEHMQSAVDDWRDIYNCKRPHESLGMAVPASIYKVSPRAYPDTLPEIAYGPCDKVRKVQDDGCISFGGKLYRIGRAFHGYPVAIRPTDVDGAFDVYFCHQRVAEIRAGSDIERVTEV